MDSLVGILFTNWFKILKENKFKVKSIYTIVFSFLSIRNSFYYHFKEKKYNNQVETVKLDKDPIFVLGHWRSGTTFLVNLLSLDNQFNYPKIYQVNNPYSFYYLSKKFSDVLNSKEAIKRPMDNIKISKMSPAEEEFAIAVMSLISSTWGWTFPQNYSYYENYLDFKEVEPRIIQKWKDTHHFFIKKLSLNDKRQLLLKSPGNSAKIKYLLELYPDAKFINIHRNPIEVYKSMQKLFRTTVEKGRFQSIENVEDKIISTYKKLYQAYFKDLPLIPNENFIDISFEDLENDKLNLLEQIYSKLKLENFSALKSKILEIEKNKEKYKKNKHNDLDTKLKQKLLIEWRQSFEKWNYVV